MMMEDWKGWQVFLTIFVLISVSTAIVVGVVVWSEHVPQKTKLKVTALGYDAGDVQAFCDYTGWDWKAVVDSPAIKKRRIDWPGLKVIRN